MQIIIFHNDATQTKKTPEIQGFLCADNRNRTCTVSHQILSLARLQVPPYPQKLYIRKKRQPPFLRRIKKPVSEDTGFNEASGIRTPDNLIKSQVLYRLS